MKRCYLTYMERVENLEKCYDEEMLIRHNYENIKFRQRKLLEEGILVKRSNIQTTVVPWRTLQRTTTGQFEMMRCMDMKIDFQIIVISKDKPDPEVENVHRLQLIRASPVFETMLMHNTLEAKRGKIIITDLSLRAVRNMIHFIYCDEIQLESFDEAYEVALAAEKYQIKQLLDISVSLLFKFLSCDNVWSALKLADHLKLQDLTDCCIEVLQTIPLNCIYSEEFLNISEENMILFLEQDVINFHNNELLLVDATVNWARHEAKRRGLLGDDAGVRTVIEPNILSLLRLATIPLEQFKTGPGLSNWLTESEKDQIMEYHQLENAQNLPQHLSSSKKQREIVQKIDCNYKNRNVYHCKRKVIATEDNNIRLVNRVRDCSKCIRLLPLQFLIPQNKCAHGRAVFRVNFKCRLLGFECPSRIWNNPDPTLLSSESRQFYNEIVQIAVLKKGPSLIRTVGSELIFQMQHTEKTMYDSSIIVKFPKAVKLEENIWYFLLVTFNAPPDNENLPVEYPYYTRPNKVVCKISGVKFVIQNQKIPGYWSSKNDGVFQTFFVTTE